LFSIVYGPVSLCYPSGKAWAEHHTKRQVQLAGWRILDKLVDVPRIGLEELGPPGAARRRCVSI